MTAALVILAAYFIGAIPFGYLVAKARGVDIFVAGSGNIGATNVGRVLGRKFGVLVLVLDALKGALPVAAAKTVGIGDLPADAVPVAAGLAAFLGHLFPVYLKFRGGKGVATGAGVVAVLVPGPAAGALLAWLAVFCANRYVSLASIKAAVVLCILRLATTPGPFDAENVILSLFCLLAAGLVIAKHHANIARLLHGTENRVSESPAMLTFTKIVHVLSMGLWFGSICLFTFVVGLTLFSTFGKLTEKPAAERPLWLPVPKELDRDRPSDSFPDPLRKEQGSRLAGAAVGPMFPQFFLLQTVCGVLALATAFSWLSSHPERVNNVRVIVLALALVTVAADWLLANQVNHLRDVRSTTSDAVLLNPSATPAEIKAADDGRADFGRWHTYSLLVSFLTLILVAVAMALTAKMPEANAEGKVQNAEREEAPASAGLQ